MNKRPLNKREMRTLRKLAAQAAKAEDYFSLDELEAYANEQRQKEAQAPALRFLSELTNLEKTSDRKRA